MKTAEDVAREIRAFAKDMLGDWYKIEHPEATAMIQSYADERVAEALQTRDRQHLAIRDERAQIAADEALECAAKLCKERKKFYDRLALQCSDTSPGNDNTAELYKEKAAVCYQLERDIRALKGDPRE